MYHNISKERKRIARFHLLGRYRTFACALLFIILISFVIDNAFSMAIGTPRVIYQYIIYIVVELLISLLLYVMEAGMLSMHLKRARGEEVNTFMVFSCFSKHADKFILAGFVNLLCMIIPSALTIYASYLISLGNASVETLLAGIGFYLLSIILTMLVQLSLLPFFFLLVEFEHITVGRAFTESFKIMKGHRLQLLYLYCSFLPLFFVSLLSFGIGLLWVYPYLQQTLALFYLEVTGRPASLPEVENPTANENPIDQTHFDQMI